MTGGTALSEFYFKHRLSEDIDLFSEEEVNPRVVDAFLKKASEPLRIQTFQSINFLGLYTYKLQYRDGETLKVDFNYYPFLPIEKGAMFGKLKVSSVYDVAVNKLHTISRKPRARDYVDLYIIFKKSEYKPEQYLERMRIDSQAKFDWPLEIKNLSIAFSKVQDFGEKELPNMLVPFDRNDMEDFFLRLAKSLETEIFK